MKKSSFFTILVLAVSCSTIQTSYDIDKTVDFSKYKTYAYSEDVAKLRVSDLDHDRILGAVDAEMALRGFTKSESNPDALVDLIMRTQEKVEATATNTGGFYGRYGFGGGMGTTNIHYDQWVEGTLFINLVDKSTEKIVWQGRGTKTLDDTTSPDKKESNIKNAVKAIYYNYPVKPIVKK